MLRDGALDCLPLRQTVFAPPQHERARRNFKHFLDRRQSPACDCDVFITVQILDDLALKYALVTVRPTKLICLEKSIFFFVTALND